MNHPVGTYFSKVYLNLDLNEKERKPFNGSYLSSSGFGWSFEKVGFLSCPLKVTISASTGLHRVIPYDMPQT